MLIINSLMKGVEVSLVNKLLFFLFIFLAFSCEQNDVFKHIVTSDSSKSITNFFFDALGATGVIDEGALTIDITVPYGTDVTALQASFVSTGVLVEVSGVEQISGTTSNDFTFPVTYVITAENGTTQDYTVTVTVETPPSAEKFITDFSFDALGATGVIDEGALTIDVTVPYATDVTALQATFITTGVLVEISGVEQISGITVNDFSAALVYTVTAEDSSTQDYTVTVTVSTGTPYQILNNPAGGSAVFGYSAAYGNLAEGQSVYIDTDLYIESFALSFGTIYTDVTLRLQIRDDAGSILQVQDVDLIYGSFTGGWVTWSGINRNVTSGTTLIFTVSIVGALSDSNKTSSIAFINSDTYTGGDRYTSRGSYDDTAVEDWANWGISSGNDLNFDLQGQSY